MKHGFQARRSTVTNLLSVTHFLQVNLDARKQIDVIYMDFSKAFDRVDHKLLLTKLDSFGFSDNLIQLIASYLSDRALFVQYRGFSSGLFQQLSGVPQGSVLGPLFFVIFSNDMTDLLDVPFQLYADDLKIYNVIETDEDCLKLQRNIDLIQNWARTNNLLLNINKCNVVSYSRRDTIIRFNYSIENSALQRVNEFKDLGVVFDSKLTFRSHVEYVLSKAYKSLGFVIRNGKLFDNPQTLLCLYKTYCRKREEAAIISLPQSRNPRLDISQNKFPKGQSKSSGETSNLLIVDLPSFFSSTGGKSVPHRSYRRILEASNSQRSAQAHPPPPKATLTGVPESSFRQRPPPQQLRYSCLFAQQSYVDSRTAVENVWELSSTETSLRKPATGSPYMTALEMTKRVEKLTHYLSHAWNLINSYYLKKSEREELFFKKIDHINVQIADISHRLIGMEHGFISIQTMLKHFSRGTLLQENLNTLNLYQIYIDKFYKKMEKYVMDFQDHKRTLVEFANKTLYLGVNSVPHLMLATRNLATAPDFLKLLFKRFAPGNKEFFCKEHQSSQQALDNFLTAIILTNTKGYVLVQVAYMVKTLYSEENFKKDAEEATKMFERDINDVIVATKKYMVKASTEMWRCDPDHHVRDTTNKCAPLVGGTSVHCVTSQAVLVDL
ncbi:hypothetical protein GEV33_005772 [Tenebrio molitor]|uniref:Reverse transcriptase domain-containing protein n=1 Tax=Tenebrio molitor TaxID=7067 RepID=A0A8J6HLT2_TENMO|nr:hypothetical protein GEV33_005772 [Tenebrio molitor]